MLFHLDENVDPAIAEGLKRRGIDVSTPHRAGLLGANDADHLKFAQRESRVIITHDPDFLRLHAQGFLHNGIVYSSKGSRGVGELLHFLVILAECMTAEEMQNHVEFF
jgi:hypothetical protein